MDKLIKTYYQEFESYKKIWIFKNKFFLLFLFSLFLFCVSIFYVFKNIELVNQSKGNFLLFLTGSFEVCTLLLQNKLRKQKDKKILTKYRLLYNNDNLTLKEIKKKWFNKALDIPNHEYVNFVEKIEKFYTTKQKYSEATITRDKIYDFIFSVDSKNRVVTMFMGIVALFSAILIASGVNIESIFDLFNSISIFNTFFSIFLISLLLFGFFYIIKYINLFFIKIHDFIFDNFLRNQKISNRKKQIFILQLLELSALPKKKIKVYAKLDVAEGN